MNVDGCIRIACVVEVALELSFEMISTSREAHKSLITILKGLFLPPSQTEFLVWVCLTIWSLSLHLPRETSKISNLTIYRPPLTSYIMTSSYYNITSILSIFVCHFIIYCGLFLATIIMMIIKLN